MKSCHWRLFGDVVDHARILLIYLFMKQGWTFVATICNKRYRLYHISNGGLDIVLPVTFKVADQYLPRKIFLSEVNESNNEISESIRCC